MEKKPFAVGRYQNGKKIITLADGTEITTPMNRDVSVELTITVKESAAAVEVIEGEAMEFTITDTPVYVRTSGNTSPGSISAAEIKAYMDSVRAMDDPTPWWKRIFRRKK
jgi:hypothetical protein